MLDTSEQHARAILSEYVRDVSAAIGGQLEAIVLTGSLSTGSYVPGPGDIDQITIVRDSAPDRVVDEVQQIRKAVLERHEQAINMADVVYRRSELERPWQTEYDLRRETRHLATVPEDLLRMSDHGQIVFGNDTLLESLETPTVNEVTEYHRRWRRWNADFKRQNASFATNSLEPTVRLAVQSILSSAPWHYYFYTQGRTSFNKNTIARKIRKDIPAYSFLDTLDAATKIRLSGNFDLTDASRYDITSRYKEFFTWTGSHDVDQVPLR